MTQAIGFSAQVSESDQLESRVGHRRAFSPRPFKPLGGFQVNQWKYSNCTRCAIMCRFERYPDLCEKETLACWSCKESQPRNKFPAWVEEGTNGNLKLTQRICKKVVGYLLYIKLAYDRSRWSTSPDRAQYVTLQDGSKCDIVEERFVCQCCRWEVSRKSGCYCGKTTWKIDAGWQLGIFWLRHLHQSDPVQIYNDSARGTTRIVGSERIQHERSA